MFMRKSVFRSALAALALVVLGSPASAFTTGGFHGIGQDAGPGYIITINADGSTTVTNNHLASYDTGGDDTYIGVVNNSGFSLTSVTLSSSQPIFGFDGDGITNGGSSLVTGALPFGVDNGGVAFAEPAHSVPGFSTGVGRDYAGPNMWFSVVNVNLGTVHFEAGGVDANGGTAYFGLEDDINAANGTLNVGNITTTPEPASLALIGLGSLGMAGYTWRRRRQGIIKLA